MFEGSELIGLPSNRIARLGIAYCPEERGIFASLNVEENLMLPPQVRPGGMSVERSTTLFPNLAERRRSQGTKLSGGEQQMLAIARILRTGARLLLLDEPTEGWPRSSCSRSARVIGTLKRKGFTILLVEQNFRFAATVADRHYVVEHGRVIDEIANDRARRRTSASCTNISACVTARSQNRSAAMKVFFAVAAARACACSARRRQRRRPGQDRRAQRHVRALFRYRRQGLGDRRQDGGRGFRGRCSARRSRWSPADHQNKPDVGSSIARQWYDRRRRRR